LVCDEALIGVLSLYSTEVNGFNDDHKRIIEAVARQIAHTFKSAVEFDGASRRDHLTGLPNLDQLEQFVGARGGIVQQSPFTLLFIDIVELKDINTRYGRIVGDEALRHVVRHATAGLRLAKILFRYGRLVALLNDTNSESARIISERIREKIRNLPVTSWA
jgi:diguanylate cyclase (GGDEF)-like protein